MKVLSFILLNCGLQIFLKVSISCRAEKYIVVNWQIKTCKSHKFNFCIAQFFSSITHIFTHGVFKNQWENKPTQDVPPPFLIVEETLGESVRWNHNLWKNHKNHSNIDESVLPKKEYSPLNKGKYFPKTAPGVVFPDKGEIATGFWLSHVVWRKAEAVNQGGSQFNFPPPTPSPNTREIQDKT